MSSNFIGSQIAIITKSQCRYTGTIIGIDAQASSILLGNVKCFGTENRRGNFSNNQMAGTVVPIMQFANSDIEDLKIVEEEQMVETSSSSKQQQQQSSVLPSMQPVITSPPRPPSIHDDPAIVSAVVSSTNNDLSMSSRLIHDLQHLNLVDEQSKNLPKNDESRIPTGSGELGPSWSLLTSSRQGDTQTAGNKSKFFDDFSLNNSDRSQQQQWSSSNTHSNQHSHYNQPEDDNNNFSIRQPFFSNERSYPQQQQQHRFQNGGHMQNQQRYYHNNNYNNNNQRRTYMNNNNNQRRIGGGGNRETFNDNGNNYDDDFDFESSNRKFNKIASEDEFKQQIEPIPNQYIQSNSPITTEYEPIYDKRKSFFDNITQDDTSDIQAPMYNRTRNQDTFGNDRNQRQRIRGGGAIGGHRRSNNNNNNNNNYRQQQQQGNENFYYRQNNNNGYHYRH